MLETVAGYLKAEGYSVIFKVNSNIMTIWMLISVAIPRRENWSTLVKKIFVKWQTYHVTHGNTVRV